MTSMINTNIKQTTPNDYQAPKLQEVGDWQVVTLQVSPPSGGGGGGPIGSSFPPPAAGSEK